ncbi:carboxypeptidase-like regulatory domain-containing protein [Archangium violaceum]|uniref:carboxypeptidase-like regulatory domain-containing protein n=1 Tax=Archangium violaceum TaxID=83451 RepID=UPI0036D8DB30
MRALLHAVGPREERFTNQARVMVADEQGRFTFEALGAEVHWLTATSGKRYASADVDLRGFLSPPEVVLELGDMLHVEGVVRDEAGSPIAAARVSLGWAEASTDASGHYRLGPLVRGRDHRFDVSALHYIDIKNQGLDQELAPDMNPVDFTLKRAASIEGTVVDEDGRPVPNVDFWLREESGDEERLGRVVDGVDKAWSDEAGHFC